MSNPRRLSPNEIRRIQQAEKTLEELKKVLGHNYRYILSMQQIQQAFEDQNDSFSILQNRIAMQKINAIIKQSAGKFNIILLNAIQKEWQLTNDSYWKGLKNVFGKTVKEVQYFDEIRKEATADVRSTADESRNFYNQKRGGVTISDRVWKLHANIPMEMDAMVQNAIKQGKSADNLAKNINKYLEEPDKIFRKVRNKKTGELEWSEAAKKYNPGRGIYRSSYKNAMRLARTEINRAYRSAEWEAYQDNNLIYGYEIVLSNNTENQCDVCKRLAGVYPKWFKWTGWHPQCRCRMVPVQMPKADWEKLLKLRFEGKESEFKPAFIENLPPQFIEYLQENSERIQSAATLPYWWEDNLERIKNL